MLAGRCLLLAEGVSAQLRRLSLSPQAEGNVYTSLPAKAGVTVATGTISTPTTDSGSASECHRADVSVPTFDLR